MRPSLDEHIESFFRDLAGAFRDLASGLNTGVTVELGKKDEWSVSGRRGKVLAELSACSDDGLHLALDVWRDGELVREERLPLSTPINDLCDKLLAACF